MAAISPPKAVKAVDWNSCLHWGKRNNLSPADIDFLSFYGQNSHQSGYFAARMLMLLAGEDAQEIVIFRKINEGIVGSNQPVSYTHLYRQLLQEMEKLQVHKRIRQIVTEHACHAGSLETVSYTHLDVYKRQDFNNCVPIYCSAKNSEYPCRSFTLVTD